MDLTLMVLGIALGATLATLIFLMIKYSKKRQTPIVGVFSISEDGHIVMRFTKRIPDFMDCSFVKMRVDASVKQAFREENAPYNGN